MRVRLTARLPREKLLRFDCPPLSPSAAMIYRSRHAFLFPPVLGLPLGYGCAKMVSSSAAYSGILWGYTIHFKTPQGSVQ